VKFKRLLARYPLLAFFGMVYLLSLLALFAIGLPKLHGKNSVSSLPLVVFPIIVIGVGVIGVTLTFVVSGKPGLRELRARFFQPVRRRWYAVLLIPPICIVAVLIALKTFVSSAFAPNFFMFGIAAGILAGFFEEFGWTGFAYPRMRERFGPSAAALLLGVLWGIWHLPVVDSLGAASPHGTAWPAFFAAFVLLMTAVRLLIAWVYDNTDSLRMAQLVHASSTGCLVILSAPQVTPWQETGWYFAYAVVLWIVVVAFRMRVRPASLSERPRRAMRSPERDRA
jgi:membrane protease YdiL (CAAX protease family)